MSTTVDEFGRVVPSSAPLSSSRGPPRGRSSSPPPPYAGGGRGGRGRSRSRHDSRDRDRGDHHHNGGGGGGGREWRKRPRSPSPEDLASPPRITARLKHPSYRYVEDPMLCEFVWKSQQEQNDDKNEKDDKEGDAEKESYDEYRKRYSLNYVRSFFNTHMDDSWFRSRYSPLGKKRGIISERERAKQEARVLQSQLESSLKENHGDQRCTFVQQARLGGGTKTTFIDNGSVNEVPKTQALSVASPDHILHITDIPPHITDEQLTLAIMDHCLIPNEEQAVGSPVPSDGVKLVSTSVSADRAKNPLWRDAFFICSAAVKQDIVAHLTKADDNRNSSSTTKATDDKADMKSPEEPDVVVPRKDKEAHAKARVIIPLDVECSDAYGRLEVDADGKGGAPDDGVGVPPRKSTVLVDTQYKSVPVQVLSAAVSSRKRFGRDKEAAIMLARALDVAKNIPSELRLDEVLDTAFGANRNAEEAGDPSLIEDILDVAIAYLRRVHLFSFYNGCTTATNVADVLSGKHPAGTIHLRLKNADEILADDDPPFQSQSDSSAVPPPKDLLVSRLDSSIEKALEDSNTWINSGGSTIVSEREDEEAAELEKAEEEWKNTWLENHAIIDDDGRARCSFHFCHKLFKDTNFLEKHLVKKHKEFLKAEQAQLHDEYMMKAWDAEDKRPVPPVLVDCGANFDLVPSPVIGAEPMAIDPEPELWRKEEERRKREEELQRERQERFEQRRQSREHRPERHENHPSQQPGPQRDRPVKTFVDVDDMKEEKVEMSFDNIDVPVQPPKKKKKKKKLL